MISSWVTQRGLDFVILKWKHPDYEPQIYHVQVSCRLISQAEGDYVSKRYDLESSSTDAIASGLLPESTCLLTLFAVYNPASIDPGLQVTVETLPLPQAIGMI